MKHLTIPQLRLYTKILTYEIHFNHGINRYYESGNIQYYPAQPKGIELNRSAKEMRIAEELDDMNLITMSGYNRSTLAYIDYDKNVLLDDPIFS